MQISNLLGMTKWIFFCFSAIFIALTLGINQAAAQSNNPQFDWFEYQGSDSIYQKPKADASEYLNPIIAGFHPDPSICRVGDDYYLVNSSFSYFPGVPIFHSKDLVHWTHIGYVLSRPSQLNLDSLDISQGIFAPTIRYHDGIFYMITTLVGGGGTFLVTAKNPAGPWSDPVWFHGINGIDPSLFFDDDGKAYIVNNGPPPEKPEYPGHRALWIQEFDPATQTMTGPRSVIVDGGTDISKKPVWIEGPHIFKKDGIYYLIAAQGGTGSNHSEVVFRSDSVLGPYIPYQNNPILTQRNLNPDRPDPVTSTGHADFVQTQNGGWWAVFLGCRPYRDGFYNTGRETFLMPVQWHNGWPVITAGKERIPYIHKRPDLPLQPSSEIPESGNFTLRDDFNRKKLAPYWNFIRTPRKKWYSLTAKPGRLTIESRPVPLGSHGQPSFIGRRQQHIRATVSTLMRYKPQKPGDKAGLAAFQNDDYYYLLCVTLKDGKPVIQLEKKAGKQTSGKPRVIASRPLKAMHDGRIFLKIEALGDAYNFWYGYKKNHWHLLKAHADGTILSTKTAGGFVGTYFGMYAYRP